MTSQRSRAPGWALLPLLILGAALNTQAQTADADEFAYIARPGDP